MSYDIGDLIRSHASFQSAADIQYGKDNPASPPHYTDPDTVTARIKPPSGATLVLLYPNALVTRDAQGLYHTDVIPTMGGNYFVEWVATGAVQQTTKADCIPVRRSLTGLGTLLS